MRARSLKPGFFKNPELGECEPLARLLFEGLWCLADRDGKLEERPGRIKVEILPYDGCDIGRLLDQLWAKKLIRRYDVDGVDLIWIPTFRRHQNPHKNERPSELPDFSDAHEKARHSTVQLGLTPDSGLLTPDSLLPSSVPVGNSGGVSGSNEPSPESAEPPRANGVKADILRVFDHWRERMNHPSAKLDPKRDAKIRGALKLGYTVDQLVRCIDGYAASPNHMGQNDRGMVYDAIGLIFRDGDHIDQGLKFAAVPPRPMSVGDQRLAGNLRAVEDFVEEVRHENGR